VVSCSIGASSPLVIAMPEVREAVEFILELRRTQRGSAHERLGDDARRVLRWPETPTHIDERSAKTAAVESKPRP
jgi:hypothetical protein